MAWNDTKVAGNLITSADYNTRTQLITDISSNVYGVSSNYAGHSSNSSIHFTESSIDHTSILNIGTNTHVQIDTKLTSLFNTSTSLDNRLDTLEGQDVFDHTQYIISTNLYNRDWIDSLSGSIDTRLDSLEGADSPSYWSGASGYIGMSGSYSTHRQDSTTHFTKQSLDDDYAGSSNINRTLLNTISSNLDSKIDLNTTHRTSDGTDHGYIDQDVTNNSSPTFTADNFSDGGGNAIITTTQETNFTTAYNWINGSSQRYESILGSGNEYSSHLTNTSNPHTVVWSDVSTAAIADLNDNYHPSGLVISGQEYSKAYASAQIAKYTNAQIDHDQLTNFTSDEHFTQASITTVGTIGTGVWKGTSINLEYIDSGNQLHNLLQSGNEYSTAYTERGSQIAGNNLTWDGSQLNALAGGGSGGYPSGDAGWIQYKAGGGGHSGQSELAWDKDSNTLTIGGAISAQTLSGTILITSIPGYEDFLASGNEYSSAYSSGQRVKDLFDHELYIASSTAISRFTDSSNVNWTKIAAISSGFDGRLDTLEAAQAASWSGATGYINVSSNARDASNWVTGSGSRYESILGSGNEYSQAYASAQRVKDLFNHTLYSLSSNLYNQTWVDALSGSIDSRLDTLEGYDEFNHESYITSANAISRFADSSNVSGRFYPSSLGQGVSSAVYANTAHSANSSLHSFTTTNYITSANAISRFADSSNINSRFPGSSNVNWTKITAISSGFDGRLDSLEGFSSNATNLYLSIDGSNANQDIVLNNYDISCGIITPSGIYIDNERTLNIGNSNDDPALSLSYTYPYPELLVNREHPAYIRFSSNLVGSVYVPYLLGVDDNKVGRGILINKILRVRAKTASSDSNIYLDNTNSNVVGGLVIHPSWNPSAMAFYSEHADIHISPDETGEFNTIVNFGKADCDFVVHGDTSDNLIYVDAGKNTVGIGLSSSSYKFLVSGDSFFSGNVFFKDNTISGLADPLYPKSVVNKNYVDTVSGALDAKIDAVSAFDATDYITSANAIERFADSSNIISRFVESGGTKWVDLTDGGATTLHSHAGGTGISYWSSQTNKSTGSLYYNAGEVVIGPSGTDYGDYRLQVSGASYFSGNVHFIGEISGVADPTYPSGVASKHYVDTTSGNAVIAVNWVNASSQRYEELLASGTKYTASSQNVKDLFDHELYITSSTATGRFSDSSNVNWTKITAISSGFDGRLDVLEAAQASSWSGAQGYWSVSSMVNVLDTWYDASSSKLTASSQIAYYTDAHVDHDQTTNFTADEHFTQAGITTVGTIGTGVWEGTDIHLDYIESGNQLHDILLSGNEYSQSYASAQRVKDLFDHELYIASSTATGRFADSSNINTRFVASGVTLLSISSQNISGGTLSLHSDTLISSPASGEVLVYKANNARWENELPPMTYNIANVEISANHNINVTRFTCPTNTRAYIWQAAACNSGGVTTGDLCIEMLSGTTSIYKTSSAILQQGYPLGVSAIDSDIEIRFMYSGTAALSGYQYGSGFMQVSVY